MLHKSKSSKSQVPEKGFNPESKPCPGFNPQSVVRGLVLSSSQSQVQSKSYKRFQPGVQALSKL